MSTCLYAKDTLLYTIAIMQVHIRIYTLKQSYLALVITTQSYPQPWYEGDMSSAQPLSQNISYIFTEIT